MVKEGYKKVMSPKSYIGVTLRKLMPLCVLLKTRCIQDSYFLAMDGSGDMCSDSTRFHTLPLPRLDPNFTRVTNGRIL